MPALYSYRIFISHAWKYGDEYSRIVRLLDNAPYFTYYNYSAPKEKPLVLSRENATSREIAEAISDKIKRAQVVLVLGGMYGIYHNWMQFEVDEARRLGKPIIAIMPWGQINMPAYLREKADRVVGWNTSSIVSAIRELV